MRLPLYLAYRRIGIGTPKLLDRPATPGVLGAIVDFFRICIGTCVVWQCMGLAGQHVGPVHTLPLCLAALASQAPRPPVTGLPLWPPLPTGTRALGLAMAGLILSEPPAATLLLQAVLAALLLTGNREGYCSTQLLSSPLSRARMQRLAVALETATLPAAVVLHPMPSGASALGAGLPILEGAWVCQGMLALLVCTLGRLICHAQLSS